MTDIDISEAARAFGRLGGKVSSPRKTAANRAHGFQPKAKPAPAPSKPTPEAVPAFGFDELAQPEGEGSL